MSPVLPCTSKNVKKAELGIVVSDPPQYTEENLSRWPPELEVLFLVLFLISVMPSS